MEVCKMKEDELEDQEKKLIKGEITDPSQSKKIEKKTGRKSVNKEAKLKFFPAT